MKDLQYRFESSSLERLATIGFGIKLSSCEKIGCPIKKLCLWLMNVYLSVVTQTDIHGWKGNLPFLLQLEIFSGQQWFAHCQICTLISLLIQNIKWSLNDLSEIRSYCSIEKRGICTFAHCQICTLIEDRWIAVNEISALAFDHMEILHDALKIITPRPPEGGDGRTMG